MNTISIMDESRVKPMLNIYIYIFVHTMIERKQTFMKPKGNHLEARPKTMDQIKCTWVTIKRTKTMDQIKKKKKKKEKDRNTKDNLNVKVLSL